MAMNISFTFIEVFADVSMKSKLLSSAYDCASYDSETKEMISLWWNIKQVNENLENTYLEVQCSLVCKVSFVPSQSYYNIWTGLSLKLFNPVLRPHKWLLTNTTGRGGCKITIGFMRWNDEDTGVFPWYLAKLSLIFWSRCWTELQ